MESVDVALAVAAVAAAMGNHSIQFYFTFIFFSFLKFFFFLPNHIRVHLYKNCFLTKKKTFTLFFFLFVVIPTEDSSV